MTKCQAGCGEIPATNHWADAMTPHDDRRNSTAANVAEVVVTGIQIVCEGAGLVIEGVVSLLVGLLG